MSDLPNKVTKDDLDHLVAQSKTEYNNIAGTLTHCTVTLPCGWQVTGESACIDPDNYNEELGKEIALKKAIVSLWPLEGYLLANDRYRAKQPTSFVSRMVFEQSDLNEKIEKLTKFLDQPKPDFVEQSQWELMKNQQEAMVSYFNILEKRITLTLGDEPKLLKSLQ